jgi:pyruvate dehydrogenase E2 component (dihydrolipoamide acetyltransferase)
MARCPMLLLVTEAKLRPWVVDGRVEARPVLRLCASFDHRIIDGQQAGRLAQAITASVENPHLELASWTPSTTSSRSTATA